MRILPLYLIIPFTSVKFDTVVGETLSCSSSSLHFVSYM
jgi:hypothetical protein